MRTDIDTVRLVEEELTVGKKIVADGEVEVRTHTEEVAASSEVDLETQEVEVLRIPIDEVVSVAPAVRTEGDLTIIPVLEERLVVEKRLVLVEEIHIRRLASTRTETVEAVLHKQKVSIERKKNEA